MYEPPASRTPQGVRGLKTGPDPNPRGGVSGRTPQGVAWIETYFGCKGKHDVYCRTPQGVRGLKQKQAAVVFVFVPVAPRRGCVD